MGVDRLNHDIFSGRQFRLKASIRIRSNNTKGNNYESYIYNSKGQIILQYSPAKSIVLETGAGENYNYILFSTQDYQDLVDSFVYMYKSIKEDDMYFLDELNQLVLNVELAKKREIILPSMDRFVHMKPAIIKHKDLLVEGIQVILNNSTMFEMSFKELRKVAKVLDRLDIDNFMLNLSLTAHLMDIVGKNNIPVKSFKG